MSSNIRITKICDHCSQEFIAKTIQTRYCSHSCNSKAYKEAKRKEKMESVVSRINPTNPPKLNPPSVNYGNLNEKEFLTINDCSQLLNVTVVTLRRWIKDGVIDPSKSSTD